MIHRIVQVTAAGGLRLRTHPTVDPTTDSGKRLPENEVVFSLGETWDHTWQYVKASVGTGWVSSKYLRAAANAPVHAPAPAPGPMTGKFSLVGEDPELTAAIEKLRQKATVEGIEFTTADFGGVRTEADTNKILKYRDDDYAVYVRNLKRTHPGRTPTPKHIWRKIAPFGSSYHNYGAARDLRVTKHPPSFTASKALDRLRALAPSSGLQTISNDPPHVQLPITLAQARARWKSRQ